MKLSTSTLLLAFAASHLGSVSAAAIAASEIETSPKVPTNQAFRIGTTPDPDNVGVDLDNPIEVQPMEKQLFAVDICEHIHWEGKCTVYGFYAYSGECVNFNDDWQNMISSVRLNKPWMDYCEFYSNRGCRGHKFALKAKGEREADDLTLWRPGPDGAESMNDFTASVKCWRMMWGRPDSEEGSME